MTATPHAPQPRSSLSADFGRHAAAALQAMVRAIRVAAGAFSRTGREVAAAVRALREQADAMREGTARLREAMEQYMRQRRPGPPGPERTRAERSRAARVRRVANRTRIERWLAHRARSRPS